MKNNRRKNLRGPRRRKRRTILVRKGKGKNRRAIGVKQKT